MRSSTVSYGAYELKRAYQTNLGLGIAIGAALHIRAVFSIPHPTTTDIVPSIPDMPGPEGTHTLKPLPEIDFGVNPPEIAGTVLPAPNLGTIPVAVPDAEIMAEYVPPDQDRILSHRGAMDNSSGGNASAIWGHGGTGSGFGAGDAEPSPDIFIAVEIQPVRVKHVSPEYPDIARLTGREGRVAVRALIDRDGTVRRAEVAKSSGTNVGFDEAAIEAAIRCLYKPAIQNGMPVMVWVTYIVEFKLK